MNIKRLQNNNNDDRSVLFLLTTEYPLATRKKKYTSAQDGFLIAMNIVKMYCFFRCVK